ncbi:MAG: hypothetical protein K0S76_737 [Herbinix sp.]|jgi:hypothetical protein|nr:hypothetical protein [Herbinix sp.]
MKKEKSKIYNFDQDEELKIYKYALYDYLRKKKKARRLKDKYTSLKGWKNDYVMKKYEHITLNSLIDFQKYLKRKLENQIDKDTAASGFIYPIMIMIIGLYVTYTTDVISNKLIGFIVSGAFILYAAKSIIKDRINDDIAIKNLYRDYIVAIEELIQLKEKQMESDAADGSELMPG